MSIILACDFCIKNKPSLVAIALLFFIRLCKLLIYFSQQSDDCFCGSYLLDNSTRNDFTCTDMLMSLQEQISGSVYIRSCTGEKTQECGGFFIPSDNENARTFYSTIYV